VTDFRLDWEREARTGVAEAVLCEPKTTPQIAAILTEALDKAARLLLTRLAPDQHDALPALLRDRLDFDPLSRTAILGGLPQRISAPRRRPRARLLSMAAPRP
jgi:NCAIR mutase (PurE)-related protein